MEDYVMVVSNLMESYKNLGCRMSLLSAANVSTRTFK